MFLPICPDSMDTVPCVQTLWTPSHVSRLYGHPVYIHTLLAVLRHSAGPHSCDTVVEHNQWWYNAVVGHTVVKHSDSTLTTVCTKDTYCYCNAVIKQRHISCIVLYIIFIFIWVGLLWPSPPPHLSKVPIFTQLLLLLIIIPVMLMHSCIFARYSYFFREIEICHF